MRHLWHPEVPTPLRPRCLLRVVSVKQAVCSTLLIRSELQRPQLAEVSLSPPFMTASLITLVSSCSCAIVWGCSPLCLPGVACRTRPAGTGTASSVALLFQERVNVLPGVPFLQLVGAPAVLARRGVHTACLLAQRPFVATRAGSRSQITAPRFFRITMGVRSLLGRASTHACRCSRALYGSTRCRRAELPALGAIENPVDPRLPEQQAPRPTSRAHRLFAHAQENSPRTGAWRRSGASPGRYRRYRRAAARTNIPVAA